MDQLALLKRKLEREIASRKEAERILEDRSRELYHAKTELERVNKELKVDVINLFENSAFGIVFTSKGKIINSNTHFSKMIGYQRNELKTMLIETVTFKADVEKSIERTKQLSNNKINFFEVRKRYLRKDGSMFWGQTMVSPVYDVDGNEAYHLAIVKDIQYVVETEQTQQTLIKTLELQNEKLEAFAHMVSHDLKSPLRAVSSLTQWLQEDLSGTLEQEHEGFLKEIDSRVTKMNDLIDGILDYSRVDKEVEKKEFSTKELIEYVVSFLYQPTDFKLKLIGNFPTFYANYFKIHQLFQNLIDNAIKHNDKKTCKIIVEAEQDKEFFIFKIIDNGPGIPEDQFEKVFEIFNSVDTNKQNTGIGLSIVKKVAEHYNGGVIIDSKVGEGTTFTISFSKKRVAHEK